MFRFVNGPLVRRQPRLRRKVEEMFDEQGPDAPLDEVVKRAKIGAGTLYRHFSTREKLLEAVYREEIVKLAERAYPLLDQQPAEQALAGWLRAQLRFVRQNRGLAASLKRRWTPRARPSTTAGPPCAPRRPTRCCPSYSTACVDGHPSGTVRPTTVHDRRIRPR